MNRSRSRTLEFRWLVVWSSVLLATPALAEDSQPSPVTQQTPVQNARMDTRQTRAEPSASVISWRRGWNLVILPNPAHTSAFPEDVQIWRYSGYGSLPPEGAPEKVQSVSAWHHQLKGGQQRFHEDQHPHAAAWLYATERGSQVFDAPPTPATTSTSGSTGRDTLGWKLSHEAAIRSGSDLRHQQVQGWDPEAKRYRSINTKEELERGNAYFVRIGREPEVSPSPAAPSKLIITHTQRKVFLSWDQPTEWSDGGTMPPDTQIRYALYRDGALQQGELTATEAQDEVPERERIYHYHLRAFIQDGTGQTAWSADSAKVAHFVGQPATPLRPGAFEPPHAASPPRIAAFQPKLLVTQEGRQTITHLAYIVKGEDQQNDRIHYRRSQRFLAPDPQSFPTEPIVIEATGADTKILELAIAGHGSTIDLAWVESSRQTDPRGKASSRMVHMRRSQECTGLSFCIENDPVVRDGPAYKRELSMAYDRHGHHHMVWSEANKVYYMKDLVLETDQNGQPISVFDAHKQSVKAEWIKTQVQYAKVNGECPCGDCWCDDVYLAEELDSTGPHIQGRQDAFVYTPSLHINSKTVSIVARRTKLWDDSPVPNPLWDRMYETPIYSSEVVFGLRPTKHVVGWRKTWKTAYEPGDDALYNDLGIRYQYRYQGTWHHEDRIHIAQRALTEHEGAHLSEGWQDTTEPGWRISVVDDAFGPEITDKVSYPTLTTTPSGRMIAVYEKGASMDPNRPAGNPIILQYSDDGGQTWSSNPVPLSHGHRPVVGVAQKPDGTEEIVILHYTPVRASHPETGSVGTVRVSRSTDLVHYNTEALNHAETHPAKPLHYSGYGEHADIFLGLPSLATHQDLILAAWVEETVHGRDRIMLTRASSSTEVRGLSVTPPSTTLTAGTSVQVEIRAENQYHMTVKPIGRTDSSPTAPMAGDTPTGSARSLPIETAAEPNRTPAADEAATPHPLRFDLVEGVALASVPVEWILDPPRVDGSDLAVFVPKVRLVQGLAQSNFEKAQALRKALLKPLDQDRTQWVQTEYTPASANPPRWFGSKEPPSATTPGSLEGDDLDAAVLAGFERAWVYTQGIALTRAVRQHEHLEAAGLARRLCDRKNAVWAGDKILGWHFSRNSQDDTWKDARLVTGASAWAVHGLGTFLVSSAFQDLDESDKEHLRTCYRGALEGLRDHRVSVGLKDRVRKSAGEICATETCAYLMTAGWTTQGLKYAHQPSALGLTQDPDEGWFYYDVLDAIGYDHFAESNPPSIRRTRRAGELGNTTRFELTASEFAVLQKRTRAENVVTEHNLDVLSVLNHSLRHIDKLWPEASDNAQQTRRAGLQRWRDGVQRGIFELLWDEPPEKKDHTERKAPNACRTEAKTIAMTGRVITGGTFGQDGRFLVNPEVAIDNCSWLALSVDYTDLPPERVEQLFTCLNYAVDKFADHMPFGSKNQCYYGAHYFPNSFQDAYINPSTQQEVSYHLEATTGLILGLHRFHEAHPENSQTLEEHARALWSGVQSFVRDHGLMYSSQRIQDLSTRLASSTAAIWYLDTYDALEGPATDLAARETSLPRPLTASVFGPHPEAVAHLSLALETVKQVGAKEAFKIALLEISHIAAMSSIVTAMNEDEIDALVDQVFLEEDHNVVLVEEHVEFTVPTDFEFIGFENTFPPETGKALYDWPLQTIIERPSEWNDAFALSVMEGLDLVLGPELRQQAVQGFSALLESKTPQHIILKKVGSGVEIYRKVSGDLWSGAAPRGIVLHLDSPENGPALVHRQPGSWSRWFETHVETTDLSEEHQNAYLREVGAWLLDGILQTPGRPSFDAVRAAIRSKITGEDSEIKYVGANGFSEKEAAPPVGKTFTPAEGTGAFAYFGLPFEAYVAGVRGAGELAYYVSSKPPKEIFVGIEPEGTHDNLLRHLFVEPGSFITLTKDPSLESGTMPELAEALRQGNGRAWVYTLRPPEATVDVPSTLQALGIEVSSAHQNRLLATYEILSDNVFSAYQVGPGGTPIAGTGKTSRGYRKKIRTPDGIEAKTLIDARPLTDLELAKQALTLNQAYPDTPFTIAETNRARLATPTVVLRGDEKQPTGQDGAFVTGLGPSRDTDGTASPGTSVTNALATAHLFRGGPFKATRTFIYYIENNGRAYNVDAISKFGEHGEIVFLGPIDPEEIIGAQEYVRDPKTGKETKGEYFVNEHYVPKGPFSPPSPILKDADLKALTVVGTETHQSAFYKGSYVGSMSLGANGFLELDLHDGIAEQQSFAFVRTAVVAMHKHAQKRAQERGWPIQGLIDQWNGSSKSLAAFRTNRAQGKSLSASAEQTEMGEIAALLGYPQAHEVRPYQEGGAQVSFTPKGSTPRSVHLRLTDSPESRFTQSFVRDGLRTAAHNFAQKNPTSTHIEELRTYARTVRVKIEAGSKEEFGEVRLPFDGALKDLPETERLNFLLEVINTTLHRKHFHILQLDGLSASSDLNERLRRALLRLRTGLLEIESQIDQTSYDSFVEKQRAILNTQPIVVQIVSTRAPSQLKGGLRPRKKHNYNVEQVANDLWTETSFVKATTSPHEIQTSLKWVDKHAWLYTAVVPPERAIDLSSWANKDNTNRTFEKGAHILVADGIEWENVASWAPIDREGPVKPVANQDFTSDVYDAQTLNEVDQALATTIAYTGTALSDPIPRWGDSLDCCGPITTTLSFELFTPPIPRKSGFADVIVWNHTRGRELGRAWVDESGTLHFYFQNMDYKGSEEGAEEPPSIRSRRKRVLHTLLEQILKQEARVGKKVVAGVADWLEGDPELKSLSQAISEESRKLKHTPGSPLSHHTTAKYNAVANSLVGQEFTDHGFVLNSVQKDQVSMTAGFLRTTGVAPGRKAALEDLLGYRFINADVLELALTPEATGFNNMEYLGDAVFQVAALQEMMERYPETNPKHLLDLTSDAVTNASLDRLGRKLKLHLALNLSPWAESNNWRDSTQKATADSVEGLVGGMFRDQHKLEPVHKHIAPLLNTPLELPSPNNPWRTLRLWAEETYGEDTKVRQENELEPDGRITSRVVVGDEVIGKATAPTTEAAQKSALADAFVSHDTLLKRVLPTYGEPSKNTPLKQQFPSTRVTLSPDEQAFAQSFASLIPDASLFAYLFRPDVHPNEHGRLNLLGRAVLSLVGRNNGIDRFPFPSQHVEAQETQYAAWAFRIGLGKVVASSAPYTKRYGEALRHSLRVFLGLVFLVSGLDGVNGVVEPMLDYKQAPPQIAAPSSPLHLRLALFSMEVFGHEPTYLTEQIREDQYYTEIRSGRSVLGYGEGATPTDSEYEALSDAVLRNEVPGQDLQHETRWIRKPKTPSDSRALPASSKFETPSVFSRKLPAHEGGAMRPLEELSDAIGYDFPKTRIIDHATTHPFFLQLSKFGLLGFVGDPVLKLLSTEDAMERFPDEDVTKVSGFASQRISEPQLAMAARGMDLQDWLRLPKSKQSLRNDDATLARTFAALTASMYYHEEGEVKTIRPLIIPPLSPPKQSMPPVKQWALLSEHAPTALGLDGALRYDTILEKDGTQTTTVWIGDVTITETEGQRSEALALEDIFQKNDRLAKIRTEREAQLPKPAPLLTQLEPPANIDLDSKERQLLQKLPIVMTAPSRLVYVTRSHTYPLQSGRLSLLGERVFSLLVTERTAAQYPNKSDQERKKRKAYAKTGLAYYAWQLGLHEVLSTASPERDYASGLQFTFRALIGLMYVEGGMSLVRTLVGPVIEFKLHTSITESPRSEHAQRVGHWVLKEYDSPLRRKTEQTGGGYVAQLFAGNKALVEAEGADEAAATQNALQQMIDAHQIP